MTATLDITVLGTVTGIITEGMTAVIGLPGAAAAHTIID